MTATNQQLAEAARDLAARSDGLRRRAWLCVGIALGTTSSMQGAARSLAVIEMRDVRTAAQQLMTELADSEGEREEA